MEEDVVLYIHERVNPVSAKYIVTILEEFDKMSYDVSEDIYTLMAKPAGKDPIGKMITDVILTKSIYLLAEMGIVIEKEIDVYLISEILVGLNGLDDLPNESKQTLLDDMDEDEDVLILMAKAISFHNELVGWITVFDVIEGYSIKLIDNAIAVLQNQPPAVTDDEDELTDALIKSQISVVLKFLSSLKVDGLFVNGIFSDGLKVDMPVEKMIGIYDFDDIATTDVKGMALDICSMLIVGVNSRYRMLETYYDLIEDLIDDPAIRDALNEAMESIVVEVKELIENKELNKLSIKA